MADLKPCPFCGGEAETCVGPILGKWGTRCKTCDVWRDDRENSEAEAIAAWNRRAPDPRDEVIRGMVEALKAIDVGQSAIPDHWEYRCMARKTADDALAAAAKAYGVALPTIVHQRKTGKSTRSVK